MQLFVLVYAVLLSNLSTRPPTHDQSELLGARLNRICFRKDASCHLLYPIYLINKISRLTGEDALSAKLSRSQQASEPAELRTVQRQSSLLRLLRLATQICEGRN